MNILAIQLKRIGDLILTTPALAEMHARGARVTLVVDSPCASLLPAIRSADEALVYSKKSTNRELWKRIRERTWDICLDFTGSDRSALLAWLSRAPRRATFQWVRKRLLRRLAYHEFVDSPVRLAHTCDHYCDLLRSIGFERIGAHCPLLDPPDSAHKNAAMLLAEKGLKKDYAIIHPGTARPEKYWLSTRWIEAASHLHQKGLAVVVTHGPDAFEKAHAEQITHAFRDSPAETILVAPPDLLSLASLVQNARMVASCDTSIVHFAAAFQKPQIALYGPTNPFHWHPRHPRALIISASQPHAEIKNFLPKMAGAPMDKILTPIVLRGIDKLLATAP